MSLKNQIILINSLFSEDLLPMRLFEAHTHIIYFITRNTISSVDRPNEKTGGRCLRRLKTKPDVDRADYLLINISARSPCGSLSVSAGKQIGWNSFRSKTKMLQSSSQLFTVFSVYNIGATNNAMLCV